jgi:hypothetical protein
VGLWTVAAVAAFVAAYLTAVESQLQPSDASVKSGEDSHVTRV